MKRIIRVTSGVFVAVLILTSFLVAGNDYFWAGDRKVHITLDSSSLIIVFKPNSYHKNNPSVYSSVPDLAEIIVSQDHRMLVLDFHKKQTRSRSDILLQLGLQHDDIEWYSFGYMDNGVKPLRPTNRISFQLKSDVTEETLLQYLKGRGIIDHTAFGTQVLK